MVLVGRLSFEWHRCVAVLHRHGARLNLGRCDIVVLVGTDALELDRRPHKLSVVFDVGR